MTQSSGSNFLWVLMCLAFTLRELASYARWSHGVDHSLHLVTVLGGIFLPRGDELFSRAEVCTHEHI